MFGAFFPACYFSGDYFPRGTAVVPQPETPSAFAPRIHVTPRDTTIRGRVRLDPFTVTGFLEIIPADITGKGLAALEFLAVHGYAEAIPAAITVDTDLSVAGLSLDGHANMDARPVPPARQRPHAKEDEELLEWYLETLLRG